jgi:hypothetical protein
MADQGQNRAVRGMVPTVWSEDQQQMLHLGTYQKCDSWVPQIYRTGISGDKTHEWGFQQVPWMILVPIQA